MRILAVVAHPDDEVLMCGGTLARFGGEVLVLGDGRPGGTQSSDCSRASAAGGWRLVQVKLPCFRKLAGADQRFGEALPLCQAADDIRTVLGAEETDIIITHSPADLNQDHTYTFQATMIAARGINFRELWAGEPEYCAAPFTPTVYVDVRDTFAAKLRALACYGTEAEREYPHPRSRKALTARAQGHGVTSGLGLAEGFTLIRGRI